MCKVVFESHKNANTNSASGASLGPMLRKSKPSLMTRAIGIGTEYMGSLGHREKPFDLDVQMTSVYALYLSL